MSDNPRMVRIKPNIDIPDLQQFGITDFQAGYEKLSPMERNALWQTLMDVGFQLATGRSVSGRSYHKLMMMIQMTWPEVAIEDHIFEDVYPVGRRPEGRASSPVSVEPPPVAPVEARMPDQSIVEPTVEPAVDRQSGPGDAPAVASGSGGPATPFSSLLG